MTPSRRNSWRRLTIGLWLAAVAAWAQEAPEPVVLTLLGTNYTAGELGIENGADDRRRVLAVLTKIQHGILGTYGQRAEFEVSEAELAEYCRQLIPAGEELGSKLDTSDWFEKTWAEWQDGGERSDERIMAASDIRSWKINQSLFERYGGRVYGATMCPPLALEAGWAYLAEREKAGDFAIPDAGLRAEYWKRLREMKPPAALEIDGLATFARSPGEYVKQQVLEFGHRRGMVPPVPVP
ncbi:MAG TPA: hypothetical protein P5204_02585 [Kiritimatiellia bacterium]|nr:hypothetical protein [Kiritimatiellia bacterium]